ncbi:MAG: hypothetical protein H6835_14920 [Planctomycetes bacterium]|nr:hypothetical protein [Planctomycetota bacterium]
MATPDDISDMFDDELTQSIVKGQDGPWRDEQPQFEDPALKAIEAELAGNKRLDYRQRRMEELKRRGIDPENAPQRVGKRPAAAGQKADPAAPGPTWGEGEFTEPGDALFADSTAEAAAAAPDTPVAGPARAPSPWAPFGVAVACALFVIAAAAAAHALLTGWSIELALRALGAGVVTGMLWQHFRTGRLRSTAIATCTYTAAFLPSEQIGRVEHILALFLGLFAVVAGAALLGDRRVRF